MPLKSTADAAALARLHAACFAAPWDAAAFEGLLAQPGVFALAAGEGQAGFILCRAAAQECEILTFAVQPECQGRGYGSALLAAAIAQAVQRGAETLFLEVAADNAPALALYRKHGFAEAGRRPAYYAAGGKDALVMRLNLA